MKILRSILAVVGGFIVSMGTIMGVHMIGQFIYPLPNGVDPSDTEKLRELLPTMPLGALLMVVLAWESGAFVGGLIAALIAGRARCVHAGIIGAWVLLGTIRNFRMLPGHPEWMIIAGLVLPLPVSLLAGKIVATLLPPPPAASNP